MFILPNSSDLIRNQAGRRYDSVLTSGSLHLAKGSDPNMVGYLSEKQTNDMSTVDSSITNDCEEVCGIFSLTDIRRKRYFTES